MILILILPIQIIKLFSHAELKITDVNVCAKSVQCSTFANLLSKTHTAVLYSTEMNIFRKALFAS